MPKIQPIKKLEDIPESYRNNPIGLLLRYHNFGEEHHTYPGAKLLIGMCMDNRKMLSLPDNFAFVLRTGGANLRHNQFKVSFAVAIGGIRHIVLMGHTQCGMLNLSEKKGAFIKGLCEAGWEKEAAEKHFALHSPKFEIKNTADFIYTEAKKLSRKYPEVQVAPLLYKVEDNLLYWINK